MIPSILATGVEKFSKGFLPTPKKNEVKYLSISAEMQVWFLVIVQNTRRSTYFFKFLLAVSNDKNIFQAFITTSKNLDTLLPEK